MLKDTYFSPQIELEIQFAREGKSHLMSQILSSLLWVGPKSLYIFLVSLMFWNVCGIGNAETFSHVKFLCRSFGVGILVLVKPKISGTSTDKVCRNLGFDGSF